MVSEERIRPGPLGTELSERFESFVAGLRSVFHRADQFLRCRAYLRGVLESSERKNVEAIAAAAAAVMTVEANLPQALQHFVSNSPWDHRRFAGRLRDQTRQHRQDEAAVWVIHDAVFAKKGRHSVGVHRQFARSLGRKVNCQIGVILAQTGPCGYFPLAARLYVPGAWLRDHVDTAARQIPEADRQLQSRGEIALALLEEVREGGEPVRRVSAESGYVSSGDFHGELTKKGFAAVDPVGEELASSLQHFDWLKTDFGLDHFEGRNWHGWHHHVALVFAAYHFAAIHRTKRPVTG
jgi:SRSO17 transposase